MLIFLIFKSHLCLYGYIHIHIYGWTSLVAQLVKNPPAMWGPGFDPWLQKIPWRRDRPPIPLFWPGEFQGLYSPWGRKESDLTEWLALICDYILALCIIFDCHTFYFNDYISICNICFASGRYWTRDANII